jgi:hypothetical protein
MWQFHVEHSLMAHLAQLIAPPAVGEENHHDQLDRFGQLAAILLIIIGFLFAGQPNLVCLLLPAPAAPAIV